MNSLASIQHQRIPLVNANVMSVIDRCVYACKKCQLYYIYIVLFWESTFVCKETKQQKVRRQKRTTTLFSFKLLINEAVTVLRLMKILVA